MIAPARFAPGMALQLERFREALAGGMPRRGWKVGINVPEVLDRVGLPHSAVGWLDGRRVFRSGEAIAARPGARLHVEPEVAVVLSRPVPAGSAADAARAGIARVHPALEVVDYAKASAGIDDVIAHCMFHDATVVGAAAAPELIRELGGRWPDLRTGARNAAPPRGDLVPSDPGELVVFVADYLAAFDQSLQAGDILLSGSYTSEALAVGAGEEVVADFGPLGTVTLTVAAPAPPA